MNISFIGFMASGKSTIAKLLSEESGKRLISIDEEIEKDLNMTVSEIFHTYGEQYFRNLETKKLIEAYKQDNVIVDCGGGAAIYNEELIKNNSYVIFVDTEFNIIWERLLNSADRPLSQNKSYEELKQLYDSRNIIYQRMADDIVNQR